MQYTILAWVDQYFFITSISKLFMLTIFALVYPIDQDMKPVNCHIWWVLHFYYNETCDNFLSGEHRCEIWICHGQLPPEGSFSFMLDLPLLSHFSTRKIENIYSCGIHGNTKLCNTTLSYLKIYFKFNIYKLEKKTRAFQ